MSVYKLEASQVGGDAEASLDIRVDGILNACALIMRVSLMDALSDFISCEVSFGSTGSFVSNDTLQSIFMHCVTQNFLTTGGGCGSNSASISGLKIPVFAGERIFLHSTRVAAVSITNAFLYVEDGVELKASRRRR